MQESLFSPLWHHVSELRPVLRPGVRIQRQRYRNETWYLLVDETTSRQHRINAAACQFIGRFDGRASVHALWSLLLEKFGERAPGQDEIVYTLQRLAEAEFVQFAGGADLAGLFRRSAERARRRSALVNPLALSVPLFDPSRFIAPLEPLGRWLFRPGVAVALAILCLAALLAAAMNWPALHTHAATHLASAYYVGLAWASYPFIKLLHELAHALAVGRWGGAVREFGITFLLFTPAPYTDASAAAAFRDRWQRAVVSAAGILVELGLAALALLAWLALERGVLSDLAFVVMSLCVASSLLFNGNPLLRFDGYHFLCDVLDTPNLALRSHAYWVHLLRRLLCAAPGAAPTSAPGEAKWLIAYAPLSWTYRLFLSAALVLWVGGKSAPLGWLAAAVLGFFVVVRPAHATFAAFWHSLPAGRMRRRAGAAMTLAGVLAGAVLLFVPVPSTVIVQGVVWPADQARVRTEVDGFVVEVLARDGQAVEPGTALLVLAEPTLVAERDTLQARLLGLRARQYDAVLREPAQARNVLEELERTRAELDRAQQRIAQWTVRSKATGRLVLPRAGDLVGSFAPKGTTLAYVLEPAPALVRAVVPEEYAALLRARKPAVRVQLADRREEARARLVREVPAATHTLPSAALSAAYRVDPADREGLRLLEPVFLFDVSLEAPLPRLGARASVRFDLGSEPLALQWERRVRQALLRHFNPVS